MDYLENIQIYFTAEALLGLSTEDFTAGSQRNSECLEAVKQ